MTNKLCFAMNYCEGDVVLAQKNAALLQKTYPSAQVILVEDKPRLKIPPHAGQWTARWMWVTMRTDADIILKIDPDTRALKAATSFPTADIFGQPAPVGTYFPKSNSILCGGVIGFQRAALAKILGGSLLLDPKYNEKPYACRERRPPQRGETIILQDPIVADIAAKLGLTTAVWPGLHLQMSWEPQVKEPSGTLFKHPVKE